MQWLRRGFAVIIGFLDALCSVLLVVCAGSTFLNVVARYIFSRPLTWGEEISVLCVVWIVFLSQGLLEVTNDQLAMTVLYRAAGKQHRHLINAFRTAVTIAISVWLLVVSFGTISMNYTTGIATYALALPCWIVYLALPLGFVGIAVARTLDPFVKVAEEGSKERGSN